MALIRPTLAFLLLLSLLLGGIYPFVMTQVTQAAFPHATQGSLIKGKDGELLGSKLIGQNFSGTNYFWGRVSATSPNAYNASNSSGSNFGANNPALQDAVKARVGALHGAGAVPADLVTSSGSGLDPEISPEAAEYQIARVAHARGLSQESLRSYVRKYTKERQFNVLGEPRVNVLELNLALDGKL